MISIIGKTETTWTMLKDSIIINAGAYYKVKKQNTLIKHLLSKNSIAPGLKDYPNYRVK